MSVIKQMAVLVVACVVGLSAPLAAHAGLSSVDKSDAAAFEGSQAFPSVTFTFDAPYDFASLDLYVDFDHTLLELNAAAATMSIGPLTGFYYQVLDGLAALPPPDNLIYVDSNVDGQYSLSAFFPTSYTISDVPGPASVSITGAFQFLPAFTAGMSTTVHVYGSFGEATGPLTQTLTEFDVPLIQIAAIPEPETWLMLLGGLGLLAARARRGSPRT